MLAQQYVTVYHKLFDTAKTRGISIHFYSLVFTFFIFIFYFTSQMLHGLNNYDYSVR
jgi:hypothetical protein